MFNETMVSESYKTHLTDLTEWNDASPAVIGKILMKIYNRAL